MTTLNIILQAPQSGGTFQFASANPMWRASLELLDFLPLVTVDYSGGIIITDWYGEENENDAIKITIQFVSNEVRSDALNIKVFKKKCLKVMFNGSNCDQKSQLSEILTEPLNPRDYTTNWQYSVN